MGRESPLPYPVNPGSNHNYDTANCGRTLEPYFYMNPGTFLQSNPLHSSSGSITNGIEGPIWPHHHQINLSPHSSTSPIYNTIHFSQPLSSSSSSSSSMNKHISPPWSSALLSAYMLHFWPGSFAGGSSSTSNNNSSQSGRLSPTGNPLKQTSSSSSSNSLVSSSNSLEQNSSSSPLQHSMLELLRKKAQNQRCSIFDNLEKK